MVYRCRATSLEGFIQQLAVSYVARGYWFYVKGWIPHSKAPEAIDGKLMNLHRAVNRVRKTAGLSEVPVECLRLRRRLVRPFERAGG